MSVVSSIFSGIMGSNAAQNAAGVEQKAAQQAQALEYTNQQNALNTQNQVWTGTQQAEQPYQALGQTSANALANRISQGFTAPTLADAENTPGYQFTLQQGTNAINQNAAANGTLLSGNTGKALEDYGQGLASTTYQQDYQNALNTYMTNVNAAMTGTNAGLTSTGQLATAGQATAQNTGYIDLTGAQQQAQQINNAAAARASGILGSAKALSTMAGSLGAQSPWQLSNFQATGPLGAYS